MLDTIRSCITKKRPPFQEFYMNYIMTVQDRNIELEIRHMKDKNFLTPMSMNLLIDKVAKEVNIYDSFNKLTEFL